VHGLREPTWVNHPCSQLLAEAPAKVLTEHRNALAKEQGSKRELTEKNASRHYQRTVKRHSFAMGIRVSTYVHEEDGRSVPIKWLKPSDILRFLLEKYPSLLLGGLEPGAESEAMLSSFWEQYRFNHGSHAVFAANDPLHRTIPLSLHGDGARTQKKQPMEVVSLEPVLGIESFQCTQRHCDECDCPPSKRRLVNGQYGNPLVQRLNHKNHSYVSRFLTFAYPSKVINMPGLLDALLQKVGDDLGQICDEGIVVPSGHWKFGVLGYKGDMEFHKKLHLTRSYANVGSVNAIKCCHECEAGCREHPFEDSNTSATWLATRYTELPWTRSPFIGIPFEDWSGARDGRASMFFRRDTFHIFRLGLARNYIASVIIMLANHSVFDCPEDTDFGIGRRLKSAWAQCYLWCCTVGTKPATVRSFTCEKLHYKSGSYPWISCKGSDTVIFLKWLQFQIKLIMPQHSGGPLASPLQTMLLGVQTGLIFTRHPHRHGLWLQKSCALKLRNACSKFLFAYAVLADKCLQDRVSLFGMVPKFHAMAHYKADIDEMLRLPGNAEDLILNPAVFDCSVNEDFVGKIAKQSRRIGFRRVLDNLITAYLVKFKFTTKRYFEQKRC